MAVKLKLRRGKATGMAPAPSAVQAGDYIYTSSIYPVGPLAEPVVTEERLGAAGPSVMEKQARHCLETLKSTLEELGSSLDRVLKVDVHLVDAADFYEFKRVWREFFPVDPPARTTVEVGPHLVFPGARLNLDAVALAGDSKLRRQILSDPLGPDPLEAEWAAPAVRAGNLVFCSGFTASNFKTGLAVGKLPQYPNYGNDAEMQAEYVFANLERVMREGGTSLEHAVESQLYEPSLLTFHDVDRVWIRYMPVPPPRSSMGMTGLIVPGACFVANLTVLVPDAKHVKQASREGIHWHPSRKANFSPTIKAGPWRFFAGQFASPDFLVIQGAPSGLPHHFSDIEIQTRFTMNLLTEQLEANDTDWDHCHHVRVFLLNPDRDYRGFLRVWRELFPDVTKAPALCVIPTTGMMFPGPMIEIDPTCIAKN